MKKERGTASRNGKYSGGAQLNQSYCSRFSYFVFPAEYGMRFQGKKEEQEVIQEGGREEEEGEEGAEKFAAKREEGPGF